MEVSDARRLRQLEEENARLKKLLADTMLDNAVLKDVVSKNGDVRGKEARCVGGAEGARHQRAAGMCNPQTDRTLVRYMSRRGDGDRPEPGGARVALAEERTKRGRAG
jgi:putative transposase